MSTAGVSASGPNPAIIFDTINAYQRSAALKTAIELDLFTAIAQGNRTVEAIANAISASPRGVRILCDFLVISGFLSKNDTQYSLTLDSGTFLDRNSPAYLGSAVRFLLDPRLISPFLNLTDTVRAGTPELPDDGTASPESPIWVDFAREMASTAMPSATDLAGLVAGDHPIKVLDIAAGHGLFGIVIAQRNNKAHITALDWPNVLEVAIENARKFGVADRHSTLPGDALDVEFGGPYDLVLVTNFFQIFDVPNCEKLMRKIFAALAPGGKCATQGFIPNEDRVSPPAPGGFAMMMLGTTPSGDAYTFAEYERMFRNAGFASSEFHPPTRGPQAVIISRKA